jgi:hypothetical protein
MTFLMIRFPGDNYPDIITNVSTEVEALAKFRAQYNWTPSYKPYGMVTTSAEEDAFLKKNGRLPWQRAHK